MQKYTTGQIASMSLNELALSYNTVAEKSIKRFKDKETGIRRVTELFKTLGLIGAKKAAQKSSGGGGGTRCGAFNFPKAKEIREHRAGTKRATVIDMLRVGATFEEVQKSIGWDSRTAREGIKLVHSCVGYGLNEDKNGVITLVE